MGAQRRQRDSARVIVINGDGHVLLFRVEDKAYGSPPCWILPGGGVEAGEGLRAAAVRELWEETGLRVEPDALLGPVAFSAGDWEFRGEPLSSVDTFFVLRVEQFEPESNNRDVIEVDIMGEHRWWPPEELAECTIDVWPRGIAELVRDLHAGVEFTEARQLSF